MGLVPGEQISTDRIWLAVPEPTERQRNRKSDQSRDGLCVAELRKRVLSRYAVVNSGVLTR